jgi:ferredoxin
MPLDNAVSLLHYALERGVNMIDTAALWRKLELQRRQLKIMDRFCTGCGSCVAACTNQALAVIDGKARVDAERCILCGYCAPACPEFMIRVV